MERTQTQTRGDVTVTVAVPSAEEAAAVFGVPLTRRSIQPVWVRIENSDDAEYLFLPADMDPDYFSPQEVAWMFRSGFSSQAERDMQVYLDEQAIHLSIPPGKVREGFVLTNQDYGVKHVSVVLYHPGHTKIFEFVVEVPGIQADYKQVDFDKAVPRQSRYEVDLGGTAPGSRGLSVLRLGSGWRDSGRSAQYRCRRARTGQYLPPVRAARLGSRGDGDRRHGREHHLVIAVR
jgi:hypothetical protein